MKRMILEVVTRCCIPVWLLVLVFAQIVPMVAGATGAGLCASGGRGAV